MSALRDPAQRCLVAVCAHLAMTTVRDENFRMWLEVLRDVVADCADGPAVLTPLLIEAEALAFAEGYSAHCHAMARVRREVAAYYRIAAADAHERWRQAGGRAA